MFSAVAAVFFESQFILVFELVFGCDIVPAAADGADKAEFDGGVFGGHRRNLEFKIEVYAVCLYS